ncbi:hypothetical protein WG66_014804, partial [Moniliophthora roreri]
MSINAQLCAASQDTGLQSGLKQAWYRTCRSENPARAPNVVDRCRDLRHVPELSRASEVDVNNGLVNRGRYAKFHSHLLPSHRLCEPILTYSLSNLLYCYLFLRHDSLHDVLYHSSYSRLEPVPR